VFLAVFVLPDQEMSHRKAAIPPDVIRDVHQTP